MAKRRKGRDVSGILLLDKAAGITSNGALQEVKRLFDARKAGHTGSLDPIATGLLPICLGHATKISAFLLGADKRYAATVRLGVSTATGDAEGEVLQQRPVEVSADQLERAVAEFRGEIQQVPPMYSALKVGGKPLYKLARAGQVVEREPRTMQVFELIAERIDDAHVRLTLHCSGGFYVRQLAHDLGEALGCGGHVSELRRTGVADLRAADAYSVERLGALGRDFNALDACLVRADTALSRFPAVTLGLDASWYFCRGNAVRAIEDRRSGEVRVYSEKFGFLGIGEIDPDGKVAPRRLFVSAGE